MLDKGDLATRALEPLGGDASTSEALLIDNKIRNVEAWERRDGRGYLFRDDATFPRDLRGPLAELATSAAWNVG